MLLCHDPGVFSHNHQQHQQHIEVTAEVPQLHDAEGGSGGAPVVAKRQGCHFRFTFCLSLTFASITPGRALLG